MTPAPMAASAPTPHRDHADPAAPVTSKRPGDDPAAAAGRRAVAFVGIQALLWFCWVLFSRSAPPGDNIEQLNWTHALEAGYYKHPPLPTWLLHPFYELFGPAVWSTYALAQCCVAFAMWMMWRSCAMLAGARSATIALVALSSVYYFGAHAHVFNHNSVLLVPIALAFHSTVSIARGGGRMHWLLLGLAIGAGLLVKYQMVVFAGPFIVGLIASGVWRAPGARRDALLGAMIALCLVTPHVAWLVRNDFPTFVYASRSLAAQLSPLDRIANAVSFIVQQFGRVLPMVATVALARWIPDRSGLPAMDACHVATDRRVSPWPLSVVSLCVWPTCLTLASGVVGGAHLQNHWGTGLLLMAMPLLALTTSGWAARLRVRPLVAAALVVQLTIAVGSHAITHSAWAPSKDQSTFPASALASAGLALWRETLPGTLPPIVIGPDFEAGLMAVGLPNAPDVLIHAMPALAPWVSRARADACGALVVWEHGPDATSRTLTPLPWDLDARILVTRSVELARAGRAGNSIVVTLGVVGPVRDAPAPGASGTSGAARSCPADAATNSSLPVHAE